MLTPKQENFCRVYRETGNATEAYRQSYDVSRMKPESINRKAKEVLDNGNISARLDELGAATAKRHEITIDDLIEELEQARQTALSCDQSSAAVSATMGKAKLLGMDKQVVDHTSSDNSMSPKPAIELDAKMVKSILEKISADI